LTTAGSWREFDAVCLLHLHVSREAGRLPSFIGMEKPRAMRTDEDSQRVTSRLTIPDRSDFILESSKCSAIVAF
jgi:hypothetical protein